MEVIGLVIIIAGLMMWYGVFGSLETGARMANRRVAQYEREQKAGLVQEIKKMDIKKTDVEAAKKAMEEIDGIDL